MTAKEALKNLVEKLEIVSKASEHIFVMASLHGQNYTGPTYEKELMEAKKVLQED